MLRLAAVVALVVALVTATPAVNASAGGGGGDPLPELDLASPSLSPGGRDLAGAAVLDAAPRYALTVRVDPRNGAVAGRVHADLPAPAANELHFRMFAGLLGADTETKVEDVTIAGDRVDSSLETSLLTVSVPPGAREQRVDIAMRFSYRLPAVEGGAPGAFGGLGETLDPAEVGLLGRHQGGAALGHWFPIWLPPTVSAESAPEGFGDIGNFPAAVISARISVPEGYEVVSSGVNVGEDEQEGGRTFVEEGVGLRDLGVYVGRRRITEEVAAGDVTVRVTGPRSARDELTAVGGEASASLTTFSEVFAPYPWSELDVVSVPLGSGVAGMEWPGMVWIEAGTFVGGLPGLGELPDLGEIFDDLEELLEDLGVDGFEELLPDLGALTGGASSREFTIFHEVAHQWWHALVGNDSIAAPVVDEPLAQFSACVAAERREPDTGAEACTSHTDGQYETMRLLGEEDAPADQPTDAFSSSLQYGGVVYGKAPGLYRALGDLLGPDAVLAALGGFASTYAFGVAGPDELRAALAAAAPGRAAEIDALWLRWIDEAHGDEDLGVDVEPDGADPGPVEGLDDLQALLDLLEGLTTGGR